MLVCISTDATSTFRGRLCDTTWCYWIRGPGMNLRIASHVRAVMGFSLELWKCESAVGLPGLRHALELSEPLSS